MSTAVVETMESVHVSVYCDKWVSVLLIMCSCLRPCDIYEH